VALATGFSFSVGESRGLQPHERALTTRNVKHFEEIAYSLVNFWEAYKQGTGNTEQGIEEPVG
jgi:hypothetical protein